MEQNQVAGEKYLNFEISINYQISMVHFPTLSKEKMNSIIEQALRSARCSQLKTIFVAIKRLKK
jgi:hypothetical protein